MESQELKGLTVATCCVKDTHGKSEDSRMYWKLRVISFSCGKWDKPQTIAESSLSSGVCVAFA